MTTDTQSFYDTIAPFYDLIYPDWNASIARQARQISDVIQQEGLTDDSTILDVSCGIGTQTLGLSALGYEVTASDLSAEEIKRAGKEAKDRNLDVSFSVCDMRETFSHHQKQFDVVLSADNSVPHLLSDDDILTAFQQFFLATRPGGMCIITVRDYDSEALESGVIRPYAVKERDDGRDLIFQVWSVNGSLYETSMYMIRDQREGECRTVVSRAMYYAVPVSRLIELLEEAGFVSVSRLDDAFFQPMIIGRRPV